MRRAFAVLGMHAVGYYDLSAAAIPVHSTAFRPVEREALATNPFRVFTSLLRLELIEDAALRAQAQQLLASRQIFTDSALVLIEQAEQQGGLDDADAAVFVRELLETFRWHSRALVDEQTYHSLHDAHRLIADVVSFRGPHINHLTPRTLDIDACQQAMQAQGLPAKAVIEGPPARHCPLLLRQTSFKALEEPVDFVSHDGRPRSGTHTARFGEIEQRGIALTRAGRQRYDALLAQTRRRITPAADGSNAAQYVRILNDVFADFPDQWRAIHDQGLGYFRYALGEHPECFAAGDSTAQCLDNGSLQIHPMVYEDFLPVSAAGIFQSNLGDDAADQSFHSGAHKAAFEQALGAVTQDEFSLYARIQDASLAQSLAQLNASDRQPPGTPDHSDNPA